MSLKYTLPNFVSQVPSHHFTFCALGGTYLTPLAGTAPSIDATATAAMTTERGRIRRRLSTSSASTPRRALHALDQRARAEAAAAAHGHEAELLVGALELVQQRGDEPRAGRAERVAKGHRA